jgi:hypothetical protein
MVLA